MKQPGTWRLIAGIRHIIGSLHKKTAAILLFLTAAGGLAFLIQGCSFALVEEGMPAAAQSVNPDSSPSSDPVSEELSGAFIRFHVIGNSDSAADQELKQEVRQAVTDYLRPLLEEAAEIETARTILTDELPAITELTQELLAEAGAGYGCSASLETVFFPLKIYGDIALPPGEYEALRIVLGSGGGRNWWCVMFPPLCFIDASIGILPEESKEDLRLLLTEDAYDSILQKELEWEPRFFLIDWIRELFL